MTRAFAHVLAFAAGFAIVWIGAARADGAGALTGPAPANTPCVYARGFSLLSSGAALRRSRAEYSSTGAFERVQKSFAGVRHA